MIEITKITVGGEDFLNIKMIKFDPQIVSKIMSIDGWGVSREPMTYGLPYSKAQELHEKTFEYMVIWKSEGDSMGALTGGIDTSTIPEDYIVKYTPKIPLRAHQIQTFNLLLQRDSLLIADQEGVGKTPPILCSHEAKIQLGLAKWGIFITKAALTYDVMNQARKFTNMNIVVLGGTVKKRMNFYHELVERNDIDLVIISYELYRQDLDNILMLHRQKPFSITYCDEMHKVRNLGTNPASDKGTGARLAKDIHRLETNQRYGITATPVINELLDCYNILAWLGVMPYNYFTFLKKFCIQDGYGRIISYQNVGEFKTLLQSNMLRRLKTQVLDLPPVIHKPIYVEMTPAQRKLYREVEQADEDYEFEELSFEDVPTELAKFARLMQITESAEVVGGTEGKKGSAKLAALEELLEEIVDRGEKAVVFTRSRVFCNIMLDFFSKYNPATIHGDINAQANAGEDVSPRQMQIDKFQDDPSCHVIFCVSSAAREGATLTTANNIISTSKDWSPAYESQKLGRVWRFGQEGGSTGSINVYSLIAQGTIDEKVELLLTEKQFVIESSVEQPMSTDKILSMLNDKEVVTV